MELLRGTTESRRHAKRLRRDLSLPEVLLWQQLRRGQTGFHWRKQHPAGPYVLDFYCDKAKLCVELDSEAHERGARPERDARRDAWLAERGVLTLRIAASDVLRNLDGVVLHIITRAQGRAPLHHPPGAGGPPPPDKLGED